MTLRPRFPFGCHGAPLRGPLLAVVLACSVAARGTHAADEPGVRYKLGLLERGPAWTAERTPRTDSLQAGHMANIVRMAGMGVLAAAGPFAGRGELRGLFVWEPGTERVDTLLAPDPAIASGRLVCRVYDWVAPPGLGKDYQRRRAAVAPGEAPPRDSMVTYGLVLLRRGERYDSNPSVAVRKLITRHHAYTEKLRADGRLLFAGAIEGTGELRGVLVMKGDSATVARAMAADPAVRARRFTPQVLQWWNAWGTIPGH